MERGVQKALLRRGRLPRDDIEGKRRRVTAQPTGIREEK